MFSKEMRRSARTRLASAMNSTPAGVVSTLRVERRNSSKPMALSTRCTVRVNAGWDTLSVSDAAMKLPYSAMVQTASNSLEDRSGIDAGFMVG